MIHLPRRSLALALSLSSVAVTSAAGAPAAREADYPPVDRRADYSLADDSAFEQGCFEPCECPILEVRGLRGEFTLTPEGQDGDYRVYRVDGVDLSVARGTGTLRAQGDGTYRRGGTPLTQELVLDLSVDGGPVTRFDSGSVPVTIPFPGIAAAVSMNGFYCYDEVFAIRARPLRSASPPSDPVFPLGPMKGLAAGGTVTTWGAIKNRYPSAP